MKNLFRKTSKGTTPKALKIKCTKETKEQVSSIMKKYGWTWNEFESFIEKEGLELNMTKVLESKFSMDNINFSNEDKTEKTKFFQANDTALVILIIQGNQIITLGIEKKKDKKEKIVHSKNNSNAKSIYNLCNYFFYFFFKSFIC